MAAPNVSALEPCLVTLHPKHYNRKLHTHRNARDPGWCISTLKNISELTAQNPFMTRTRKNDQKW